MGKDPEKKGEKRAQFPRELIVHFVDLMMAADHIVAEYKKRREDDGQEFMEELGFHERAQLASILMGLQMKDAMLDDSEMRREAFQKMKELEEIRLAEEKAAAPTGTTPQQPQIVRLDPEKVSKAFAHLAENHGIPNARSREFVKLLVGTPEGQQMLAMLTYESVMRNRASQKAGGKDA